MSDNFCSENLDVVVGYDLLRLDITCNTSDTSRFAAASFSALLKDQIKCGKVLRSRFCLHQHTAKRYLSAVTVFNGLTEFKKFYGIEESADISRVSPPGSSNFIIGNGGSSFPGCAEDWLLFLKRMDAELDNLKSRIAEEFNCDDALDPVQVIVRNIELVFDVRVPTSSSETLLLEALEKHMGDFMCKVPSKTTPRLTSTDKIVEFNIGRIGRLKIYVKVRNSKYSIIRFEVAVRNVRDTGALTKNGKPTIYLEKATDLIRVLQWTENTYRSGICHSIVESMKWLNSYKGNPDYLLMRMVATLGAISSSNHIAFMEHLLRTPHRPFSAAICGGRIPKALLRSNVVRRLGRGAYAFDLDRLRELAVLDGSK